MYSIILSDTELYDIDTLFAGRYVISSSGYPIETNVVEKTSLPGAFSASPLREASASLALEATVLPQNNLELLHYIFTNAVSLRINELNADAGCVLREYNINWEQGGYRKLGKLAAVFTLLEPFFTSTRPVQQFAENVSVTYFPNTALPFSFFIPLPYVLALRFNAACTAVKLELWDMVTNKSANRLLLIESEVLGINYDQLIINTLSGRASYNNSGSDITVPANIDIRQNTSFFNLMPSIDNRYVIKVTTDADFTANISFYRRQTY
jgi:hypothetical protein